MSPFFFVLCASGAFQHVRGDNAASRACLSKTKSVVGGGVGNNVCVYSSLPDDLL